MPDKDEAVEVTVSPLEIAVEGNDHHPCVFSPSPVVHIRFTSVYHAEGQPGQAEASPSVARRHRGKMMLAILVAIVIVVTAVAVVLANRNFHYATGALVSPTTYSAPVGATSYFSDGYPSIHVLTKLPTTCQHPCNISFSFDMHYGNPLLSLFIGNDPLPVTSHNSTEGSVWDILISEADGVYNGRCSNVEFSAGNCTLSWEISDPVSYFWGYVTVNSTTLL
jgi:hypothetical protein